MVSTPVARLWAKSSAEGRPAHPLLCHLLDVGLMARAVLNRPEADHQVALLADLLGVDRQIVPDLAAFLVALHDLTKASPSFQRKSAEDWARVQEAGFRSGPFPIDGFRHEVEGCRALPALLDQADVVAAPGPSASRRALLLAISLGLGGHHGLFPCPASTSNAYPEVPASGQLQPWQAPWHQARLELLQAVRQVLLPVRTPISCAPGNLSALAMALCGLTIVCDWIASDAEAFPPYDGDVAAYLPYAEQRAAEAVARRHLWSFLPAPQADPTFATCFPGKTVRPLQEAVGPATLPNLPTQALAVIEAPTGEGKTEAALLLAERLSFRGRCRGLYFALPTMATSNQMFGRVKQHLETRAPSEGRANLMLVHGQAALSKELARLVEAANHDGLAAEDRVVADSWLLPRKRSLLSPYGVGTIDQALVGALNARHGSLRLFGLAGKVVVVDEVHAYDLYMSTILHRLLAWLRELGASVVLLSATLSKKQREKLLAAFTGRPVPPTGDETEDRYPLLTLVDAARPADPPRLVPFDASGQRTVRIELRNDGVEQRRANAEAVLEAIAGDGCVCWLCNTVDEAQQCYLALRELVEERHKEDPPELYLFHARFPLGQRRAIEEEVVRRFGPEGPRPRRAVLVATQVVEQSLDVDFDLLVTQLAPIDLLLQRIGRLYRHERHNRPLGYPPRVVVLLPPVRKGSPDFGPYAKVYQPYLLLKTLLLLTDRDAIQVPDDVRPLVEKVYGDDHPTEDVLAKHGIARVALDAALGNLVKEQDYQREEANRRLLRLPDPDGDFAAAQNLEFREEEMEDYATLSMQTRLADPSAGVILLERGDPLLETLAHADRERRLDPETLASVLERGVGVQHRSLVRHLESTADDRVRPLDAVRGLKGYHLITLEGGVYSWTDDGATYRLRLSECLGVIIEREDRRERTEPS